MGDLLLAAVSYKAPDAPSGYTYFCPTNDQALAGLYVKNFGSAGDGYAHNGIMSSNGSRAIFTSIGSTDFNGAESTYTGITVRFSGAWLNGATQFTWLFRSRFNGNTAAGTCLFRGTNTTTDYIFAWPDYDSRSYHVLVRNTGRYEYKVHRVLIPDTWYSLSYYWQASPTHTATVDGVYVPVYDFDTGVGVPIGSMEANSVDFGIWVNESFCGDVYATTNTVTYDDITNWNYQVADATYNSNWPNLFTGDVEVTWKDWSTHTP